MIQIDNPMPTNCRDCPCAYFTEGAYKDICQITKENLIDEKDKFGVPTFNYPKPKWCPLKEENEILDLYYGMSESMQKAIKDIMIVTQENRE